MDPLFANLLDLLRELDAQNIPLTVGGGFGLYLKRLHLEDRPTEIPVEGETSDGSRYSGTVFVPEAFPYLMMKLHAFGDRKNDANKNVGRHHALDAYTSDYFSVP